MTNPDGYLILKDQIFCLGDISLRPVNKLDIEKIRKWRNVQRDLLRQNHLISRKEQENYFINFVWSQFEVKQPSQILLSVLYNSILVGYGGLVNINWFDQKSEVFLLKPDFENSEKLKRVHFPYIPPTNR